ncbi:MAG: HepT-like ribonuclease domain-containing protein [Clostridium sp.]
MVRYKRNEFPKKITAAYESLKSMRLSLNLFANEEDVDMKTIYLNSVIKTFSDLTEFFLCMCEDYAIEKNIAINPEKGYIIIAAASELLDEDEIKLLQNMVRIRNRVTHDYYDREIEIKTVISIAISNGKKIVEIVNKFENYFII